VTRLQLDTDNLAPRSVAFAPRVAAARQLAAITFARGVAVFDALLPTRAPRRISIRPAGSASESSIVEALFSADGRFLFLRASGLDDVIVVSLGEDSQGELTASINFVAGGTGLTDIELPPTSLQSSGVLAVYSGSRQVMLLDADGIADRNVCLPLPDPLTRVQVLAGETVLVFDGGLRSVVAWDVSSGKSGQAVLEAGFDVFFVSPSLEKAIFRHPRVGLHGGSSALSVVSVSEDASRLRVRLHSIQLASAADALLLDDSGGRLFFAKQDAGRGFLVRLDLASLELAQMELDLPAWSLGLVSNSGTVAASHGGVDNGDLTFVPAHDLRRSSALRFIGFGLTGDLARVEEEQ